MNRKQFMQIFSILWQIPIYFYQSKFKYLMPFQYYIWLYSLSKLLC